jgi:hypothetical protein
VGKSKYDNLREIIVAGEVPSKKIAELVGNGCTASAINAARRRFLKPEECQLVNSRWRTKNYTYETKVSRLARTESCKFAVNNKIDYTEDENCIILYSSRTTKEIAKQLGRSMDAIYQQRHRLRKDLIITSD